MIAFTILITSLFFLGEHVQRFLIFAAIVIGFTYVTDRLDKLTPPQPNPIFSKP